jgi:hypothetical protein
MNLGLDLDTEAVAKSSARWGAGLDWNLVEPLTVDPALLGQDAWTRLEPTDLFDVPRCGPNVLACVATGAAARRRATPLFGLVPDRPDYVDLSSGGRVALWRDVVIGYATLLVPLNEHGVRTEPVPVVGLEAVFRLIRRRRRRPPG